MLFGLRLPIIMQAGKIEAGAKYADRIMKVFKQVLDKRLQQEREAFDSDV